MACLTMKSNNFVISQERRLAAIADRDVQILDYLGKPIQSSNPFPVTITNTPDVNQIIQNVNINWTKNLQTLFSRERRSRQLNIKVRELQLLSPQP